MRRFLARTLAAGLLVACSAIVGCEEDKPFTPFSVATSLPNSPAPVDAPPSASDQDGAPTAPVQRTAPKGARTWLWEGRTLQAPDDHVFEVGISDPAPESQRVLAWVLPTSGKSPTADSGLWAFGPNGRAATRLSAIPERLPSGGDCSYRASLEASGGGGVTSRLSVQCAQDSLPGTPERVIAVVSTSRKEPEMMRVLLEPAPPGERVSVGVDSRDRDGDGVDDLELLLELQAPGGPKEQLPLRYLFRPAGAAREKEQPQKALAQLASELSVAAVRKKEWKSVGPRVDALRRLLAYTCEELGTPRLATDNDHRVKCGDLSKSLFQLQLAKTRALANAGDHAGALGEAERADWFAHQPTQADWQALRAIIEDSLPHRAARKLARFAVVLHAHPVPHGSPLQFSDDGQLWAKFTDGEVKRLTMRGDPPLEASTQGDDSDDAPGTDSKTSAITVPTWELLPKGPGDRTVSSVVPSCQRSEVQVAFAGTGSRVVPPVPLPLLAPRPGNCRRFGSFVLEPELMGWSEGHPLLMIGGQLHHPMGRTDASRALAWGTRFGVALSNDGRLELWTGPDTSNLHHCAASPRLDEIACQRGKDVIVLGPDSSGD